MMKELLKRVDRDEVSALASRLIEIEGHEDLDVHERRVADWLATYLEHRLPGDRAEVRLQTVPGERCNVVAVLRGSSPGRRLMFNAHLDTVPGYGMPDAYRARVRDGRLYGRGAVDMKAAIAAMVTAVELLAAPDVDFAGDLVLTAVAGEESGSAGMQALVDEGIGADFAVVGEPTGMRIARAHKGSMWIEVLFHGVATHGSVPEDGVNAAYHAARFVTRVEEELVPRLARREHPVLGSPTINVGVVHGGDRPPMVPARCSVQMDRRWLPGERHGEVLREVEKLVEQMRVSDPRVDAVVSEMGGTSGFVHSPLECPSDAVGLQELQRAVSAHSSVSPEPIGVNFWTDGALLGAATGTPTVVCGPGDIAQAHSLDEWVEISQVEAATNIYVDLACRFLDVEMGKVPS
jgi:succinyl-diaminopimelate desuccinylase